MNAQSQLVILPTHAERIQRICEAVPVIETVGCKEIVTGYICEKRVLAPIREEKKAA